MSFTWMALIVKSCSTAVGTGKVASRNVLEKVLNAGNDGGFK